jgi:hypothetical protein
MDANADRCFDAALKAHRYLRENHWRDNALVGPDSGLRFNYRLGRFVKSYLPPVRGRDQYAYLQAQGYWVLSNWLLYGATGEAAFREVALASSAEMVDRQRSDGAWVYPNPAWNGRIATIEGTWAAIGLLETHRRTGDARFLAAALKWHRFLVSVIGFHADGDELAVRYFAGMPSPRVPNNSAEVLRLLAELAEATGDRAFLEHAPGLVAFLRRAQARSGEFPYALPGSVHASDRPHFQCFQYNAFECLSLLRYLALSGDDGIRPLIRAAAGFLVTGVGADGHARYSCTSDRRKIVYHAAALGAALTGAEDAGVTNCAGTAQRSYSFVLRAQKADGGFPFSVREHYVLEDRQSYPRNIVMILFHLLRAASVDASASDRLTSSSHR